MKDVKELFYRICPECQKIITHTNKFARNDSIRRNKKCISCSQKGHICPTKGQTKENNSAYKMLSEQRIGKKRENFVAWNKGLTKETDERVRIGHDRSTAALQSSYDSGKIVPWNKGIKWLEQTGELNPFYGKTHTEETKQKLRLARTADLMSKFPTSSPNYNKNACLIFEEINMQLGWNGLFATNNSSGEFYIKELGYWVDYYEPDLNIVVEFYEKYHKRRMTEDTIRQQRIEDFLNCKFYIIKEWEDHTWITVLNEYL